MSNVRITGGRLKGRRIALTKAGGARFTSAKVREAAFDLLGEVEGWTVLDLFAGAGTFTIEALSRGVDSVTAVEKDRQTAAVLASNLRALALDKDCHILNMDVRYAVPMLHKQGKRFDLIFADPPYEMGHIGSTAAILWGNPLHHPDSTLLFEHSKREGLEMGEEHGCDVRVRSYGDTVLTIVRC
jgi:16S rRNA (guanine966-N2)-methyltransferase